MGRSAKPRARRWRVDHIEGQWVSVCGPDYESESEFRVVDTDNGEVVHVFTSAGDWPFMCGPTHTGVAAVVIAPDRTHVIVTDHDGTVKNVPLPGPGAQAAPKK